MKQILLERELRGDAAGSYRSRALEECIEVEHLKKGGGAGNYRSRAIEETIEVEHLKSCSKESCGGMQQEAIYVEHLKEPKK